MSMLSFEAMCKPALIAGMTGAYVTGGALLARSAKTDDPLFLAIASAAYMVGNIGFYALVRSDGLGAATVLSSALQTIAVLLVASFWFGETITPQKLVGLTLAIIGVTLINLPSIASR